MSRPASKETSAVNEQPPVSTVADVSLRLERADSAATAADSSTGPLVALLVALLAIGFVVLRARK